MELPKIGSKFFASRTSKYLGWFIMTLQEYAGGSTMIEKDHPRKIWVGSDCHSMGTSSHTIVIMSSPDRHSPRGVFQTLGDFSSPVTPGNTANLGNGPLGHWAIPCIYTWGWLNSTHFFEVIGGDLLWMICWFYIIKRAQFGNCGHPWSHSCCWHRWGAKNIFATSDIESETMFQSWQTLLESWHSVAENPWTSAILQAWLYDYTISYLHLDEIQQKR